MTKLSDIVLTQRGSPFVLRREAYDGFWGEGLDVLVEHGIVRVEPRTDYVLVYPNQYVGTARCSGHRLSIEPRYPELLFQLRRNFPLQRRETPLEGYDPTEEQRTVSDLAVRFLVTFSATLTRGIPFNYQRQRFEGPSLVGSLNIGETIRRLAAKNVHHKAVTERSVKIPDTQVVDVIWRSTDALREYNILSPSEDALLDIMLTAIGPRTRELSLSQAITECDTLANNHSDRPDLIELALSCIEMLTYNRTSADVDAAIGSVSFSFTDADALWERAVHQAMEQAASPHGWQARLHPLRAAGTHMFGDGGPVIDPDVLVYGEGTSVLMAVDAKDFTQKAAEAAGVYQVTAYARTLGAPAAVLIYLAAGDDWKETYGDQDARVHAAGVRPTGSDSLIRLVSACHEISQQVMTSTTIKSTTA